MSVHPIDDPSLAESVNLQGHANMNLLEDVSKLTGWEINGSEGVQTAGSNSSFLHFSIDSSTSFALSPIIRKSFLLMPSIPSYRSFRPIQPSRFWRCPFAHVPRGQGRCTLLTSMNPLFRSRSLCLSEDLASIPRAAQAAVIFRPHVHNADPSFTEPSTSSSGKWNSCTFPL